MGNPELRPLSARALKSAIDSLRPYLYEANVLDLFAGQGRFGISALEEGAKKVTFVENHSKTAHALKTALEHPSIPKTGERKVLALDVFKYLNETEEKFEIVFADPPFPDWQKDYEIKLLTHIVKALSKGSILLVKHPKAMVLSSANANLSVWKMSAQKRV